MDNLRLVSEKGRIATKDNSMIFGNIVYLIDENDIKLYHLINNDNDEIQTDISSLLIN